MDNKNQTVDNGNATPQAEEKTFSQDQLNAIVQDRLSRERTKYEETQAELAKREQELAKREFTLHATEKLKEHNLPIDIMDALDSTSQEAFNAAVETIARYLNVKKKSGGPVGGMVGYTPHDTRPDDSVRQAMGLKK